MLDRLKFVLYLIPIVVAVVVFVTIVVLVLRDMRERAGQRRAFDFFAPGEVVAELRGGIGT